MSLAAGNLGNGAQDDLVIGVPKETHVNSGTNQGAVHVIFGSPTGLTSTGNQLWTQDSPGIGDVAEDDDEFGWSLTIADFGNGSTPDLAIGVPAENYEFVRSGIPGNYAHAGLVHVLYGSPSGTTSGGSQIWTQDSTGILDNREEQDEFGWSLAATNLGGLSQADLAIGSRGEDAHAGAVNVIYGANGGLSSSGNQLWSQDSPSIQGSSETNDHFGVQLEVGNVGNGAQPDLIIGAPDESFATGVNYAGTIHVIFGASTGLVSTGNQVWSQDSSGIAGTAESNDHFGAQLVVNNYGAAPEAEIATGMMNESYVSGLLSDGIVQVIYGALLGPTDTGNQIWSQDSPGVPGSASFGGYFGFSAG